MYPKKICNQLSVAAFKYNFLYKMGRKETVVCWLEYSSDLGWLEYV